MRFKHKELPFREMHTAWETETPHQRFWKKLIRQRAESHMQDVAYLRMLRNRNDLAKADQKHFGAVWAEHGTNIYKLIAKAHGEVWDSEDDQKTASKLEAHEKSDSIEQKENADLDRTREESPRGRQHQLQGIAKAGLGLVEESKVGCGGAGGLGGSPKEETPAAPKEEGFGFLFRGC